MSNKRTYIAATHDILMAALSFIIALYLRLGDEFRLDDPVIIAGTGLFTWVCAVVFSSMRLYQGVWRYASVPDLIAITKSVTLSILVFLPLLFLVNRLDGLPRSVLFINWLLLIAMLGGPRLLYRIIKDRRVAIDFNSSSIDQRIPVLLAGINSNAELFLRETLRRDHSDYRVVGIVDDDLTKVGRRLHGIRVYGDFNVVSRVVDKLRKKGKAPRKIVLSHEYLDKTLVEKLLAECETLGLTLARLPRRSELRDSQERVQIQPVAPEDLLGRAQAILDRPSMQNLITGKRVLVTGAGGTIGSELVRQVAGFSPQEMVLFEHSEFALYTIGREFSATFPDVKFQAILGDVRNAAQLESIFAAFKPELVFHAAAIKHVPIAEDNPLEVIETNIFGTKHVADACVAHGVETMVMISTDKAVNPSSIMGATKRAAECYCQALGQATPARKDGKRTVFTTVRFGNVLGSSGSVIPLFQQQLAAGGPITVTHPDMVRYFMTVREAVSLVIQAAVLGLESNVPSAIFVLDMGEPVSIRDLAIQMIRMAGLRPDVDIKITYTGLRAGEKLYEELSYDEEQLQKTAFPSILLASPKGSNIATLQTLLQPLDYAVRHYHASRALELLTTLVPEYKPHAEPITKVS